MESPLTTGGAAEVVAGIGVMASLSASPASVVDEGVAMPTGAHADPDEETEGQDDADHDGDEDEAD
jgi:hypothetical protein